MLNSADKPEYSADSAKGSTAHGYLSAREQLQAEVHFLTTDKEMREKALGVVVAGAVLIAGKVLHINLVKSGKLLEDLHLGFLPSASSESKSAFEGLRTGSRSIFGTLQETSANIDSQVKAPFVLRPETTGELPLFKGGFTLPRGVTLPDLITNIPDGPMKTRELPGLYRRNFDGIVGSRWGLENPRLDNHTITILHPRFRMPEKQVFMSKSTDRDLSLYGNKENGVGVVEYEPLPSSRPYFKAVDSVVQIVAKERGFFAGGNGFVGSGAIIHSDGIIATAGHVVPERMRLEVTTVHGTFLARVLAKKFDMEHDMAILQLRNVPRGLKFPAAEMNLGTVMKNSRVATVGHPQGLHGLYSSIGSNAGDYDVNTNVLTGIHPLFRLDSAMTGNSGGPIFDKDGAVYAVLTKTFRPVEGTIAGGDQRAFVIGEKIQDVIDLLLKPERFKKV
ncbi:MAG: serine protease [Candidatus Obscuribacterales bacterium]|nr:serine protease [Candidatus Obscuribacterales bacterium]